jgi:redox-sensitive bicupin YhaK (pirin superfamily)
VAWIGGAPSINGHLFVSAFRNTPVARRRPIPGLATPQHHKHQSNLFVGTEGASSDGSPESSSPPPPASRKIRVERNPRLPVWPVWAGVIDFLVGWIFGPEAGSKLEQNFLGGRVCPMQFDGKSTSPFLLLVHHHHNFWKWDFVFRKLSAFVLPEGFPAHPHRGFTTLTYFLPRDDNSNGGGGGGGGGFVHRDSMGVKQTYGSRGSYKNQAQWLFTGRGILHEEMFDLVQRDFGEEQPGYDSRYELYQLWVNVPGRHKLDPPRVQLLKETDCEGSRDDETAGTMPKVAMERTGVGDDGKPLVIRTSVVVIAGSYRPSEKDTVVASQADPLHSDLSILHATIEETQSSKSTESTTTGERGWTYDIPSGHETLIVYVRKGSCTMVAQTIALASGRVIGKSSAEVPIHSTVFVERSKPDFGDDAGVRERLVVLPKDRDDPVDLLVLSGKPLYLETDNAQYSGVVIEPVAMKGSMVMNNDAQIQQAYVDYQYGEMGAPWDHTLGDGEWREHVEQTKPRTAAGSRVTPPRE